MQNFVPETTFKDFTVCEKLIISLYAVFYCFEVQKRLEKHCQTYRGDWLLAGQYGQEKSVTNRGGDCAKGSPDAGYSGLLLVYHGTPFRGPHRESVSCVSGVEHLRLEHSQSRILVTRKQSLIACPLLPPTTMEKMLRECLISKESLSSTKKLRIYIHSPAFDSLNGKSTSECKIVAPVGRSPCSLIDIFIPEIQET